MIAQISYLLCAVTSFVCFALLLRAYVSSRNRLLLWSSLCFAFFTAQNGILVVDLIVFPTQIDLALVRALCGFVGGLILLCALIWENR